MLKNLKKKRLKAGLTQMQLATKAKMGRYNISLAENEVRKLSKVEEAKIRRALGLTGVENGCATNKKK